MFRIILLICLLPIISGCAQSLVGSWKFNNKDLGPLQLTFNKDFTYEVDYNVDGSKDIWGRYRLFNDRIRFDDDMARITTDCYEPGFYLYKFSQKNLVHFKLMADQCKPRKAVLKECLKRVVQP